MALAKTKKYLLKIIIVGLFLTNITSINLLIKEKKNYLDTVEANKKTISSHIDRIKELESSNLDLTSQLDYKVNMSSTIGSIRESLVKTIQDAVKKRGEETKNPKLSISNLDAMRALKSAENRVLDEYIRVTALVLATMNTETNFSHETNENPNGTKDYGIMQVNDVVIPHLKEALGENIDPINNKSDNVESGSWEVYDCYIQAKEKHPEDVIWWTYAYYNRGKYFENQDAWKNSNNPNYKEMHKQANARSSKFKEHYNFYYNELIEMLGN